MVDLAVIDEKVRQVEVRLRATDQFRHQQRIDIEKIKIEQAVIRKELAGIAKDVEEIATALNTRLSSINKSLWAGATFFLTLIAAVIGLFLKGG